MIQNIDQIIVEIKLLEADGVLEAGIHPVKGVIAEIEAAEIDKIGHQGRGDDAEAAASQPQSPQIL